ncbi:hypothetical protein LEN26_016759 [Aphanomyces euteiches]|nr:hypothetical protein LEN26_016759 [Aphanomyces euteiches]
MFRVEDELAADGNSDDDICTSLDLSKLRRLKQNAMKLFTHQDDGRYKIFIKNVTRFRLAMDFVSKGISFRQTASAIECVKVRTKTAKLSGINDHLVGRYVRSVVGACLQKIATLLGSKQVWAFALAFDGSSHRGSSFFDIRIRLPHSGVLYNFHLIALPMFDRHTSNNIVGLIIKMLDALFYQWRLKLIGTSSVGENTMTGRFKGVVRTWCIPHQMDIVVHGVTDNLDGGRWVKIIYALSVFLRAQHNLVTDMGVKCPKKTNRWMHLGNVIEFVLVHECRILTYIAGKDPNTASLPNLSSTWWTLTHAIEPAILRVNATFVALQNRSLVISQQRAQLDKLVEWLLVLFHVNCVETDQSFNDMDPSNFCTQGGYWVEITAIVHHIENQGSRAQQHFNELAEDGYYDDGGSKAYVIAQVAQFAIILITRLLSLKAERDANNDAAETEAPPVMPVDFAKMTPRLFIKDVLEPRRLHLHASKWTDDEV